MSISNDAVDDEQEDSADRIGDVPCEENDTDDDDDNTDVATDVDVVVVVGGGDGIGVISMSLRTVKASFIEIVSRSKSSIILNKRSCLKLSFLTLTNILFLAPLVTSLSIR